MSGAGTQPAGTSPAGVGTPAIAPANNGSALQDPNTGAQMASRQLDPYLGQYVINANGRIGGMTESRQLVLLACKTVLGSSAYRALGVDLSKVDRITENTQRRITDAYTAALSDLVSRKLITLTSVVVKQASGSAANVIVTWTDLTTGVEEQVTV